MNKRQFLIAPSILSADFSKLGQEVKDVVDSGADWIHFDVMDNHYVPNLTVGPMVCKAIRPHVDVPIDVHLMVEPVDELIPSFAKAGANLITFHPEASKHPDRTLSLIHDCGCKAGFALNPATSLEYLHYELDNLDMVLLMSVNPGFGNQSFIQTMIGKIAECRSLLDSYYEATGREVLLEVDGGIKENNIAEVSSAGANVFVAGSAIFGKGTKEGYKQAIDAMRKALEG